MAFEKIRALQWIADTKEDLKNIKEKHIGAECRVIKEACEYMLMSTGEWVKQTPSSDVVIPDLENYYSEENLQALSKEEIIEICNQIKI